MRTLSFLAPIRMVREATGHLEGARVAHWRDGHVWVQSPEFDRMSRAELDSLVEVMTKLGIEAEVLENQGPLPPEVDEFAEDL